MQLIRSFRLSLYLMLAVSCAALGSASDFFLPEIPYVTVFSIVLLFVAHQLEDRYSMSIRSANYVGGGLTALLALWIGFQFIRPGISLLDTMPFPASLLPYLGPALMILIPAKLLRPKHVGDYWTMYGLGLMSMALACTMASEASFGLFLFGWLILFVWSLTLFFLCREIVWPQNRTVPADDGRWMLLYASTRWVLIFGVVGLGVFLVTPRPTENRWALAMVTRGRMEVGLSMESSVDLNRTGSLTLTSEKAFDVIATEADDTPKNDLDPNQRWRGPVLSNYVDGRWLRNGAMSGPTIMLRETAEPPGGPEPQRKYAFPHLNSKQFYLKFLVSSKAGPVLPLADPIFWKPHEPAPAALLLEGGKFLNFHQYRDGSFTPEPAMRRAVYMQAVRTGDTGDLGPPLYINWQPESSQLLKLPGEVMANLRPWVLERIDELILQKKVPGIEKREMNPATGQLARRQREPIARALESFLGSSGEYSYSLDLVRGDRRIDPIVDFLRNVKTGHCERFASGLTLMLRSVGIPCQMVMGHKGCDFLEEGHYEILTNMAHAWVEVLVARPLPLGYKTVVKPNPFAPVDEENSTEIVYHWLSLDPTPGSDAGPAEATATSWIEGVWNRTEKFFRDFVVGYNTDLREGLSQKVFGKVHEGVEATNSGGWIWLVTGGSGFLLSLFLVRRKWKKSRLDPIEVALAKLPGVQFHRRLMDALRRRGIEPRAGQTPREFAIEASDQLRLAIPESADVPSEAAELYYRSRFGSETIGSEELQAFEGRLSRFERELKVLPKT